MSKQTQLFALTLILLLAAATRILHINQQSLWIDEGATWLVLRSADRIDWLARHDHHPPLYFALLDGWTKLAGTSVLALRLFSALASILSVAAVAALARTLNRGRPWFTHPAVPLSAALLLTLSDPEVVLAQDVRMYALRTLLSSASMWAYLRWTYRPSGRRALGWLLATVALLHTQYQGAYILAVQGAHALLFLRGRIRWRAFGLMALSVGLFLPWFLTYGFDQRLNDPGYFAALPSTGATLLALAQKFLGQQWPLMLGLLLLGAVMRVPGQPVRWRPFGPTFLLLLWVLFSVGVTFVGNLLAPILAPHRLLLISPALAILMAQGLRSFPTFPRRFLLTAILVYGVVTVDDYYPKEPWREVGEKVALYALPGAMVMVEAYRGDQPLFYYLDHLLPPDTTTRSLRMMRDFEPDTYPGALLDLLAGHDSVWFMHWSPDQSGFEFLAQTGHVPTALLTTDHWGNALNVYRFDRLPEGSVAEYANGMTLLQARVYPDRLRADLWWSAAAALPVDYSVSVFLLDAAGQLVAQHDSYPFEGRRPTTGWSPGEVIYDPHPLPPVELPPGRYQVAVQLYTWWDNARQPLAKGDPWAIIGVIERQA